MTGVFAQDVRPWEGGILTTVVNTFENMDGKGHGAKLECLSMMVRPLPLFLVSSTNSTAISLRNLSITDSLSFVALLCIAIPELVPSLQDRRPEIPPHELIHIDRSRS